MSNAGIKETAHRIIESLPQDATWEDLMYEIDVRQAVESGLADSVAGRTVTIDVVRARFGLQP
jgi:hypothetical protein